METVYAFPFAPPVLVSVWGGSVELAIWEVYTLENTILYVQSGCKEVYQDAFGWGFANVIEMPTPVPVESSLSLDSVTYANSVLSLPEGMPSALAIYTCDGKLVQCVQISGDTDLSMLPEGIYIISIETPDGKRTSLKVAR